MGSGVASVSIKSDRVRKRFPHSGEMVRLEGRKGLFLVKRVDRNGGVADLMQRSGRRELFEMRVPFRLIRTVPREASDAIQQFLSADSPNGGTVISQP